MAEQKFDLALFINSIRPMLPWEGPPLPTFVGPEFSLQMEPAEQERMSVECQNRQDQLLMEKGQVTSRGYRPLLGQSQAPPPTPSGYRPLS